MASGPDEDIVVPINAETATVSRRRNVTGRVTVATTTRTRDELIDELLRNEHAEIERVVLRQFVDEDPGIRQEGDVLVIPILEEVVVVERRLVLKEEVRVRRVITTEHHRETITLREQDAVITRHSVDLQAPAPERHHHEPNSLHDEKG